MNKSKENKLKNANGILREVIPRMSQLEVPITPENYHVWYEYLQGENTDLKKEIDGLLASREKFTSKVNHALYARHIYKSPEELLSSYQQDVQKLVKSLVKRIKGMTENTQQFSGSLEKYQNVLQEDPDVDTITDLIGHLIDETGSVLQSNQSMENMLHSMNKEVDVLKGNLETMNTAALTDQLTNIPNRRAFDNTINDLLADYAVEQRIFSVLLIDIDHFKAFNDTHGHAVGDQVLRYVAGTLKGGIKGVDMVSRFGGEEFVVLLPDTVYQGAMAVANNLRERVASSKLVSGSESKSLGHVTASIGVAMISADDDAASIIERADKGLYRAKDDGRNLVRGEEDIN